jgi:hypothetical protein
MVEIHSETEGASLGYQVLKENEGLKKSWQVYTGAFPIDPGKRVISVAHRIGYVPSDPISFKAGK